MNRAQLDQLLAKRPGLPYIVPKDAPAEPTIQPLAPGAIHIGQATDTGGPIGFDLGKLIDGRLLIQGNSGAGKSMLLRRLFEQAFGRVQQLLIDPDGEFSTLAEHFDVAVLSAADVLRIGGRPFALHLREHRYSAVLDLSDATSEERLQVVADIAAGLIEAPEAHWFPLLALIDEAQTIAPHYDTGDVEADTRKQAIAGLADLMGRGRKRGLAGVIATQRIAETSKAVVSKATNIVVGRTIFDRDLERAGALLGFTLGHSRALRTLSDGEFLGMGPAIAGPRRVRFRAGPVQSRHKGAAPEVSAPPTISAAAAAAMLLQVPSAETAPAEQSARGWAPAEDAIVVAGYREGLGIRAIMDRLEGAGFKRRSMGGVSTRAQNLGMTSAKANKGWTEEEDQIIADAYAREVKIIDITRLLADEGFDRGRVAVQMRAIALGITRDRVNYWTEPEKAIAVAGLEGGKPYREIIADLEAAGYHRGLTGILKFAQKNNFNRAADRWSHEDIETLRTLYEAKTPVKQIAEQLGRPIASVRTRASNLGFKQRVAWSDAEYEILVNACQAGERLIDAAAKIGRPYPNVAAVANRMGLKFQKTKSEAAQ